MRTEVKLITPQLAATYLEKNNNNRPLNKKTVAYYASQMERNLWKTTGQGLSFSSNGNIIDGQHRLQAIVSSKKSITMLVIFDVDSETFSVYDTGRNRTAGDIFSIKGIPNSTATASSVQKYYLFKNQLSFSANTRTKELKLNKSDLLQKYYENPELWADVISNASRCYTKLRLFKQSEIAAMCYYLISDKGHKEAKVYDFMLEVHGVLNETNKTTTTLRDIIVKDLISIKSLSNNYKLSLLKKTWNYFISNKNIVSLRIKEDSNVTLN